MKLDIPYYIRQVLRERRHVHVPGIGSFSLVQTAARFNDNKTILSPPSLSLSFEDIESTDNSLLKYILDTGQLTESKAKKRLDEFAQAAFNKLMNVDKFEIDGLGYIFKDKSADNVQFEPTLEKLTREFKDLKNIPLTPIQRISTSIIAPVGPPIIQDEDEPSVFGRIGWLVLIGALIALLYIFGFEKCNEDKVENNSSTIENVEADGSKPMDENAVPLEDTSSNADISKKYEEVDQLIDPEESGQPVTETDENSKGVIPAENDEAESFNENEESNNKYSGIIPASGNCVIIVGTFRKASNVTRMISKLERQGYTVYNAQFQNKTRVGLIFNCANEDLESYIQDVRKNISKKAWYLQPELEVPYVF